MGQMGIPDWVTSAGVETDDLRAGVAWHPSGFPDGHGTWWLDGLLVTGSPIKHITKEGKTQEVMAKVMKRTSDKEEAARIAIRLKGTVSVVDFWALVGNSVGPPPNPKHYMDMVVYGSATFRYILSVVEWTNKQVVPAGQTHCTPPGLEDKLVDCLVGVFRLGGTLQPEAVSVFVGAVAKLSMRTRNQSKLTGTIQEDEDILPEDVVSFVKKVDDLCETIETMCPSTGGLGPEFWTSVLDKARATASDVIDTASLHTRERALSLMYPGLVVYFWWDPEDPDDEVANSWVRGVIVSRLVGGVYVAWDAGFDGYWTTFVETTQVKREIRVPASALGCLVYRKMDTGAGGDKKVVLFNPFTPRDTPIELDTLSTDFGVQHIDTPLPYTKAPGMNAYWGVPE